MFIKIVFAAQESILLDRQPERSEDAELGDATATGKVVATSRTQGQWRRPQRRMNEYCLLEHWMVLSLDNG